MSFTDWKPETYSLIVGIIIGLVLGLSMFNLYVEKNNGMIKDYTIMPRVDFPYDNNITIFTGSIYNNNVGVPFTNANGMFLLKENWLYMHYNMPFSVVCVTFKKDKMVDKELIKIK